MIKLSGVTPVDLTGVHEPPNRIDKIGLEIEGGWRDPPIVKEKMVHDGSVIFSGFDDGRSRQTYLQREFSRRYNRNTHLDGGVSLQAEILARWDLEHPKIDHGPSIVGEIPSRPLGLTEWKEWLINAFPSHVNSTCGMHVHMSFDSPLAYQRLMCPEYPKTALEELKKWGKGRIPETHTFWQRVNGEGKQGTPSEYCQPIFQAADQAKKTGPKEFDHFASGHRYTVMHYYWGKYKTIECRVLPMFEKFEDASGAIEELIRIANGFLYATRKNKEPRTKLAIRSSGEEFNRRIEVRI